MQADAGESRQGEGEDTGRQQHTKIALPNTSYSYTSKLYYCPTRLQSQSQGSSAPGAQGGVIPARGQVSALGAHAVLPVPAALLEGLPHQYHSSETSPYNQQKVQSSPSAMKDATEQKESPPSLTPACCLS